MNSNYETNNTVWLLMAGAVFLALISILTMVTTNIVWFVAGVPLAILMFLYAINLASRINHSGRPAKRR